MNGRLGEPAEELPSCVKSLTMLSSLLSNSRSKRSKIILSLSGMAATCFLPPLYE